jgi:hypothetical protein
MSYKVWNTALDHSKAILRRRAPKLQMEPIIAGIRLRIRQSMVITDEQYVVNEPNLKLYKSWGVLDFSQIGGEVVVIESPSGPSALPPATETQSITTQHVEEAPPPATIETPAPSAQPVIVPPPLQKESPKVFMNQPKQQQQPFKSKK